jgi:hypothetical protein
MYFTQEDYRKIEKWLLANSKKDTQFVEAATPLQGNETIAFVQNGKNVKTSVKDIVDQFFLLGVSDFLNITDKYGEKNITINQAIQLIPFRSRKIGQVITFIDEYGNWAIYQFQGKALNQWNNTTLWINILGSIVVSDVVPDEEDITGVKDGDKLILKFANKKYDPEQWSGLGRTYLRKNVTTVIDSNTGQRRVTNLLSQDMMPAEDTIYILQYDYDLNGQTVIIPDNSVILFEGGTVSNGNLNFVNTTLVAETQVFKNVALEGKITNKVCTIDWFSVDKTGVTDESKTIRSLFNIATDTVIFSEGSYKFSEVDIDFPATIRGIGTVIFKPVVKYPGLASALKRVFTVNNQPYFILDNVSIIGDTQFIYNNSYIGDGLVLCNKVNKVKITNCVMGDTVSGYPNPGPTPTTTIGQLITGQDCNYFEISHCEFYNNEAFEWINITMPTLERKDLNVVFSDNYIHDYARGATPLLALCNRLEINRNIFERCYYTGSLLNAHGMYVEFNDNIVRDSRMSSILDTSEWGEYRSESVTVENNDVECLNAALVATLAANITIRNNKCKCFNALVAMGFYSNYTGKDTNTANGPTCETVIIEGNDFDFTHYDIAYNLPTAAYRAGVCVVPVYTMGNLLSIKNNKFKFVQDDVMDRRFFQIQNMYNVDFSNNNIDGIAKSPNSGFYKALIQYSLTKSLTVPQLNNICNRLTYENNTNINITGAYFIFELVSQNIDWWRVDYMSIVNNRLDSTAYISTAKGYIRRLNYEGNQGQLYLLGNNNAAIFKVGGDSKIIQANNVGIMEKGNNYWMNSNIIEVLQNCTLAKYDLASAIGTTIRVGDTVTWSAGNQWQALSGVTLTDTPIPSNSAGLPEESILQYLGVYWVKVSPTGGILLYSGIGTTAQRPTLDYTYRGSRYVNTSEGNRVQIWDGYEWLNEDGTLTSKVSII